MLKKNLVRYRLIEAHIRLVKSGNYDAARIILCLLRKGEARIGLGDADWTAEQVFETAGVSIHYSRSYNSAYVRL